ncbi:MAG: hypothetical protein U9Q84_05030 [Thermodesulfobacteriota bacterium]|nr:hypothetical protein [Thermodesulfobacteriota bacterium]
MAVQQKYLIVEAVKKQSADIVALPLHKGEKETLSFSLEHKADFVLLDDMLARSEAKALGFSVKGTLGVITKGYRRKILSIEEVRIIFDRIIERNDIWIAEGCAGAFLMA